uniref:SRR1-like domain-containing protein n=1 Tax=Glossina palpalis gambiensis TaxID=67801 RepID=A0A1B0C3F2_9MUSC
MNDEFCKVTRKKWIIRNKCMSNDQKKLHKDSPESAEVDEETFLRRLTTLRERMTDSEYFAQALVTLGEALIKLKTICQTRDNNPKRVVCFGIGSFTRSYQALHQLAFILCIQKHFSIKEAIFFDPVFRKCEKSILQRLDCLVMADNCEAKYEADMQTLFYLPHCPNCLTNNLLWRNWRRKHLKNIILINNSFESLSCSKPERLLRLDSNYILDIMSYAVELPLEDDYEVNNVFNDLSVHIFPLANLPQEGSEVWQEKEPPAYKDVEMVSAEDFAKLSIN